MKGEVRPGYKQMEVGVIPEDWEVVRLGQLVLSVEYGSSAKSSVKGDIPVLRMGNLQDGKIHWGDLVYTNDKFEIERYTLDPGDVLFNRTNTIDLVGKTSIYRGEYTAIFAGYLIRIKVDQSRLDPEYLNIVLNAEFSRRHSVKVLSVAVGQANINGQKVRTYPIPLPPTLAEQQAIAEALSDVDALIDALDRLIAKKRAIKQGAMQELLTGRRRLSGFGGEWEMRKLGELGATYGGLMGKTKSDFGNGSARYIPFLNIITNVVIDPYDLEMVCVAPSERQNQAEVGDLFFNGSSETPEEVGMCSVLLDDLGSVYLNSFCFGFRLRDHVEVYGLYLAYFFRSGEGRALLYSLAQGATRYNLSKTNFLRLEIPFPVFQEQTAIAAILSDMDAEIAALERRRDKTKLLKQGMMQELLTGRIRLV